MRNFKKIFFKPCTDDGYHRGFPGETEEEFKESLSFVDKVDFYETHIFKYSKRKGTKAARMEAQISERVKTQRSSAMIRMGEKKRRAYEAGFIGKEVEVLIEEKQRLTGRTCIPVIQKST